MAHTTRADALDHLSAAIPHLADGDLAVIATQASRLAAASSATREWTEQVGPCLTQADTARLLRKSPQAVQKDTHLLRLRTHAGAPVYPWFQFDGNRQIPTVNMIVQILRPALLDATIASWLTHPQRTTGQKRPIDALAAGDLIKVIHAAHRLADSAA